MNRKEEIENLKNRLYMLRQALKSGNQRCMTPTKQRTSVNSRDVSPSRNINLTPLTKSSASRQSEMSNTPSANTTSSKFTHIVHERSNRRKHQSIDYNPLLENKSKVQEIFEETEKLQKSLGEEIDMKIRILGKLEESVEHLSYLVTNKKEKCVELDKNVFLFSYVVKNFNNDSSNKAYIDRLIRDVENIKKRLYLLEKETADVKRQDEGLKDLIDKITPLRNKVKNENTVLKFENKKLKQNTGQMSFKIKALKEKFHHNAVIVDTMHSDLKQNIMEKQKIVNKAFSKDKRK